MADAPQSSSAQRVFRPGLMLVLFAALGGPIGGLSLAIAALILEPSQIDEYGPVYIWAFPFYGFFIGLIPASLAGAVYSVLPVKAQRVVIAPVVGFITSLGFALAVEAMVVTSTANRIPVEVTLIYAGVGAAAAFFCALFVRVLKIDRLSAGGG